MRVQCCRIIRPRSLLQDYSVLDPPHILLYPLLFPFRFESSSARKLHKLFFDRVLYHSAAIFRDDFVPSLFCAYRGSLRFLSYNSNHDRTPMIFRRIKRFFQFVQFSQCPLRTELPRTTRSNTKSLTS